MAGAVFGFNRTESGKAAGLRTTMLVCLAACLAMLQANALLDQTGKRPDSFPSLDLMRLPLGVLTGMGFIGAGAVLRRDGLVTGVTTASTLWFVTLLGLCIGGGQYRPAFAAGIAGVTVLWGLRYFEDGLQRRKKAWLITRFAAGSDGAERLVTELACIGCSTVQRGARWVETDAVIYELKLLVQWREKSDVDEIAPRFFDLAKQAGADQAQWVMVG